MTEVVLDPGRLSALLSASGQAVVATDPAQVVTEWSVDAEALYGFGAETMIGQPLDRVCPCDASRAGLASLLAGGGDVRITQIQVDGTTFPAQLHAEPTADGGAMILVRDVSTDGAPGPVAEGRFAAAFRAAALPLVICELDGTIVESNEAYALLAGRLEPPASDRFLDLIEPESRPPIAAALGTLATDPGRFEGIEVPIAGSDNHILNLSIAPVDDGPDAPPLALVQLIDVSDQLRIQTELAEIATLDPLTQVFNRSCFEPLLASMSPGQDVGLLFIDLDRFKEVNDRLGHPAGDVVLQTIAARLEAVVRDSDYVIRFGGDEFVIVCPGLAEAGAAERLGDRLRRSVTQEIDVDGEPALVSASIGVSLVQAGPDLDTEAAVGRADTAMYEAKAAGRNATVIAPLA